MTFSAFFLHARRPKEIAFEIDADDAGLSQDAEPDPGADRPDEAAPRLGEIFKEVQKSGQIRADVKNRWQLVSGGITTSGRCP